jgi:NAD(P)-dependent dehydrogenase (short-subunit alcohol dehydrogenase family)
MPAHASGDAPDLSGRTVLVTGANSGIGFETSRALAGMGARVWMLCRDEERCADARESMYRSVPGADLEVTLGDFTDLASVRSFCERFSATGEALHALVNNAGEIYGRRQITADGLERAWQVNLVAPFMLTELLRERITASAPARIVNVTSDAYKAARGIRWDDLAWERTRYRGFSAYAHAKLGVVLWTRELARRLDGTRVTANALHPGGVRTGFGEDWGGLFGFVWRLLGPFLRGPIEGAETAIWLASSHEVAGESGGYYVDMRPRDVTPAAADREASERLWDVLSEQAGLDTARDGR